MPIAEGTKLNLSRTILFAVMSLVVGVALLFIVIKLAGDGDIKLKLGDDVFRVGEVNQFADRIDEDSSPLPFSSLSGSRPIYVHHLGDDPEINWHAIDARSPSSPESCILGWDKDRQLFFDECFTQSTFPPTGEGLVRYKVSIDGSGLLSVDLNEILDE
ncbi:MAG: hypothetical protein P8J01_08135 [Acidimicrobiales bacterium]|jgi:hypothetical protein|nr:hypothetical protein [Acidimicrobiales bacterium]